MFFKIIGCISDVETIAWGKSIREYRRLRKRCGGKRRRKLEGTAVVEPVDGTVCDAELHGCEAHGIGAREFKFKRILEVQ